LTLDRQRPPVHDDRHDPSTALADAFSATRDAPSVVGTRELLPAG
jgi:hypothetical protein